MARLLTPGHPRPIAFDVHRPVVLVLVVLAVALALPLAGCNGGGATAGVDGELAILTTTGIIGDIARRVAEPYGRVESLMGPGVDPHLYKASESDVRRMAEADLILYNGLHLEGKMADVLVKMARSRPVVAVTDDVPREGLREPPEFAGQYDPHLWFDVRLWALTLKPIVRELSELDPAHRNHYQTQAEALERELSELDAWVEQQVATIPTERRVLVTAHDAFGYFGRRYGLEVVGLQGISTLSEAGLRDVERVVDLVVERRIPAIFFESSVPRRSIEAVQAAAQDQGHAVALGGELFSDALGAAGTPEGTYTGMVRHNVETIVEALR
jgi:manganese/zinc/iron transport system substrate-binding protein